MLKINESGTSDTNNKLDKTIYGGRAIAADQIEKFADLADFAEDNRFDESPLIPSFVYENLPQILKDGAEAFSDLRQKDVFLTGALGVLSGCMSSISGIYGDNISYPNLFAFITAPAASGKGSLIHAKAYGNKRHKQLLNKTTDGKAKKILFIPGNASSAALINHLGENNGKGIFFETEADTLSATFKNEWGNFSDLLRKGFHHETVSYTRKGNNEYVSIDEPQLTVVLSGTPSQVKTLINSTENGLFSRFLFYSYQSPVKWNDVSPNGEFNNIPKHFKAIEERAGEIIERLNQFESVTFNLTEIQWGVLNNTQEKDLHVAALEYGDNIVSVLKRTGIMWYRLAMILSAIRSYDKINEEVGLICDDLDFEIAQKLMETYKTHIFKVYSSLPQQVEISGKSLMNDFYDALPDIEFQRKDAIEVGFKLKIGERNIGNYLQQLVFQNKLDKTRYGKYLKIK